MRAFWSTLAALVALNVLAAFLVTIYLPEVLPTALRGPAVPMPAGPITISTRPARFENRVESIVQREFQRSGLQEVSNTSRRSTASPEGTFGAGRTFRPAASPPTVPAVLTPFGLFRIGVPGFLLALMMPCIALASGIAAMYLMPRRISAIRDAFDGSARRTLRFAVAGLVTYVLGLVVVFTAATVVTGIILAAIVVLVFSAATLLGLLAVTLVMGRWLRRHTAPAVRSPIADLALGTLVLFPLGLLPWVGWIAMTAAAALGLGALLATRFGSERRWSLGPLAGEETSALP